jgi:hypothetical protein
MAARRLIVFTLGSAFVCSQALACSWDYPVWPKNKKSDTPLFRFVVNERYGAGYINRQGKVVIPPQFFVYGNHGGDFYDGLAQVNTKDGDVFIDAAGRFVAPSNYFSLGDFSEGLAVAWLMDQRKYGYTDHTGKLVIPAKFDSASGFSDGLAAVKLGDRYGYISHSGDFAIPARFFWVHSFADGYASVIEDGPCRVAYRGPCGAPLVDDALPNCRYSIIDRSGKVVFARSYIDAKQFSEGLAPMSDGEKWGFVDYAGRVRIPLQFEDAEPFSEGLALIKQRGRYGFIDKSGAIVIQPQFFGALDFSEGIAVVMDDKQKYSFIDTAGRRAIAGQFDAASSFVMGLAHVRMGHDYYSSKWSYIDKSGKAIFTYSDQSGRGRSGQ